MSDAVLARFLERACAPERMVRTQAELLPLLGRRGPRRVVTVNLSELHHYVRDEGHRDALDAADHWTADGWPVVRALRRVGVEVERVTGSGLCADLLRPVRDGEPRRVAVFGSDDEVLDVYGQRLEEAGRRLVHTDTGHRRDWTPSAVAEALGTEPAPDLVLVAAGTPYGVPVAARVVQAAGCPVVAVGAGIGMAVGLERRAPQALQTAHLEWAWRLASDPRRLWRRYVLECVPLLPALARATRSAT